MRRQRPKRLSKHTAKPDMMRLSLQTVSYTHLRAHETPEHLVCRLLLEKIFLMIRRPPRSTRVRSSAASDVYKRQEDAIYNNDVPDITDLITKIIDGKSEK